MEGSYETLQVSRKDQVVRITLDRPDVHNAFNATMLAELNRAISWLKQEKSARVVVLTGKGKSFCAGADIQWMKEIVRYSYEQNLRESLQLAEVLENLYKLPRPTIAMVNGAAIGGGNGFVSACDIAVAAEEAIFGLSEVKIGLVPAAISPYVIRRIGESRAREYFLTGQRIPAAKAREIGLVNDVVRREKLEEKVAELVNLLLSSGPEALARCKELIFQVPRMSLEEAKDYTARMIADLRVSEEGQEGMAAFLEKRKPRWSK
ncbi:MAG: enoyl-CoA hydratase/isomerase family protein [Candidatus Aminicenantales bacterium]